MLKKLLMVVMLVCISVPVNAETEHRVAYKVAETVDMLVRAARSIYTSRVVGKLKQDGVGASQSYHGQKGYVPLPAQFIQDLSANIRLMGQKAGVENVNFQLKSKWNLNEENALEEKFDKAGWSFLEKQQKDALASGKALKDITWKAYTEVEVRGDKKYLRYFSADIASAPGCVSCHNKWEQDEIIKSDREAAGVEPGKTWKLDELMGALSISVLIE